MAEKPMWSFRAFVSQQYSALCTVLTAGLKIPLLFSSVNSSMLYPHQRCLLWPAGGKQ